MNKEEISDALNFLFGIDDVDRINFEKLTVADLEALMAVLEDNDKFLGFVRRVARQKIKGRVKKRGTKAFEKTIDKLDSLGIGKGILDSLF